MANLWYAAQNKKKIGPLTWADLRQMALAGQLQPTDMLLPDGDARWVPADTVDGLFSAAVVNSSQSRLKSALRWVGQEATATPVTCWRLVQRIFGYGKDVLRQRKAIRAAAQAQQALGEYLYKAGLGDKDTRARLVALDGQIAELEQVKKSTRTLQSERKFLLGQLANSVPPHVARSAERDRAEQARKVSQEQKEIVRKARSELLPQGSQEWRRVGVGFTVLGLGVGVTMVLLVMIGMMVSPRGGRTQTSLASDQAAVGDRRNEEMPGKFKMMEKGGAEPNEKSSKGMDIWENIISKTPKKGDPLQLAPFQRRSPQQALGWSRSKCMLCSKQRTAQEAGKFSDSDGFGFCANCGACADAFAIHRANFERNFGSPQQIERLATEYLRLIEARANQNPLYAPYYVAGFTQWGNDRVWREAWHNAAILTVPGYSEGR